MRSIRWKLALTVLIVVLVPIYALNAYFVRTFDRFTSRALEDEMRGHAYLLGAAYGGMVLDAAPDDRPRAERAFADLLSSFGARAESLFQILSTNGVVLLDSRAGSASELGVDLSSRREVALARRGEYGSSWRLTEDRKFVFYNIARPVRHRNRFAAIVRVSRHTGTITRAIMAIARNQRLALWLAVGAAVLVAGVLAQTFTRRLRRLTRAAVDYAHGSGTLQVPVRGADEIGELGRAVSRMEQELDRRNRYNRDFIATVLHELKTPLTAIKGAAELLEIGAAEKPEARRKFIANIRYEADRLARLAGELNVLTKLDTEALRAPRDEVNYTEFVRAVMSRLEPTFDSQHARLSVSVPERDLFVRIVPGRIEQVLSNLLDNALRYTPADGSVEVAVTEGPDRTVITSVRDTGCGIAPANLARVFDRFFTTEPKDKPKDYGSGLGLAIAKTIVENHQGRIWVESEPGKGATFFFSLRLARG